MQLRDSIARDLANPQIYQSLHFRLGIQSEKTTETWEGEAWCGSIMCSLSDFPIATFLGKGTVFQGAFFRVKFFNIHTEAIDSIVVQLIALFRKRRMSKVESAIRSLPESTLLSKQTNTRLFLDWKKSA